MVLASPSASSESASDWSLLERVPALSWGDDEKRLFLAFVKSEQAKKHHGAIARSCRRFDLKESKYREWNKALGNGNGEHEAAAVPVTNAPIDAPTITTPVPEPEAETIADVTERVPERAPEATVNAERAELIAKLRALLEPADQIAMEIKDPITDALIMSLSFRLEELATREGTAAETSVAEQSAPRIMPESIDAPSHVAPIAEPIEPEAPAPEPAPPAPRVEVATIVASPPPPIAQPVIPDLVPLATEPESSVVFQNIPRKLHSRQESFVVSFNLVTASKCTTYEEAFDAAVELCLRKARNVPISEVKQALDLYDPSQHGDMVQFVRKRRWRDIAPNGSTAPSAVLTGGIAMNTKPAPNEYRQHAPSPYKQAFFLGKKYHPKAFELAKNIHAQHEGPTEVPYDAMKTVAYKTFQYLAKTHDESTHGDFWTWAEPFIDQALRAHIGLAEAPTLPEKDGETVIVETGPQLSLGERSIAGTLKKMRSARATLQDAERHERVIAWVNARAEGGQASTIIEAAEPVLHAYKDTIERLADDVAKRSQGRYAARQVSDALADSVARSVRMFDPNMNDDLGGFVERGMAWVIERKFGE